MFRTLFKLVFPCFLLISGIAHAGIVIESTRYLYKEGSREVTAQIENKDGIPYLIKSWIETPKGQTPSFMATPPLFRLEAKQQNTVRLFSTGNVAAPADRESIFYFNVMAIPPLMIRMLKIIPSSWRFAIVCVWYFGQNRCLI